MAVNVNIVGRLGKDAEVINGQKGQFLSFPMATDEFKNKERCTVWLNVIYHNAKLAEWLKKGQAVNVIGTESVRLYQDRNGQTQISRDVNAINIDFVNAGSGKTQSDGAVTNETTSNETQPSTPITTGRLTPPQSEVSDDSSSVNEDDLPF